MTPVKLAVVGLGLIGSRHAELIRTTSACRLVGVCDIDSGRKGIAGRLEVPFFQDIGAMLERERPSGVIVATPSAHHVEAMELCSSRGIHALIEKPIANTMESAQRIVELSASAGTRVLVGHHRRHNPLVNETRKIVSGGEIGRLVAVSLFWTLVKPDDYYEIEWRTKRPDGGPVLINLVHELDVLRYVCGEIEQVYAHASAATRGLEVEDSVGISVSFRNGAVGTIIGSEATVAPWSYEATTKENPVYFHAAENCYYFLGTDGALGFPKMEVWKHDDGDSRGWRHPMAKSVRKVTREDPLVAQLHHFCEVVRGERSPIVDAVDGARSLAAALAVLESAATNRPVRLEE